MGQRGKSPPRFKVLALRRSGLFHYPLCAYPPARPRTVSQAVTLRLQAALDRSVIAAPYDHREATSSHAMISAPVLRMSSQSTSPARTGAGTHRRFITSIHSSCISRGTSVFDFAGTSLEAPPATCTVHVSVRSGFVSSLYAYASPRLHALPVTEYAGAAVDSFVTSS